MKPSISIATADSVGSWLPLFAAYLNFYHVSQPPEQCLSYLYERLSRHQAVAFVARQGGHPQGFVLMYRSFSSLTLKTCWLLHDLFVSPDARGCGIGRQLMERCQAFVVERNGGQIMLQTAHDNHTAQKLYESCGFRHDQEFRVYYWDSPPA